MKGILILTTLFITTSFICAQTFNKSLSGMYESTSGSDWLSFKDNGTGRLCITSDYMDLGCLSFTWTSDDDQIFIKFQDEYGYETSKWSYWSTKNGITNLDFPTGFGPNLNFIKTR